MADQSITQLPVANTVTGSEVTVLVQHGITKQVPISLIANAVSPGKLITNVTYDSATGYLTFYYSDGTTTTVGPVSGWSGYSGLSGYSGAAGVSGYSGAAGVSGYS